MIPGVNIIRGKAGTASINIGEGSGVTLSPSVGVFFWGGAGGGGQSPMKIFRL